MKEFARTLCFAILALVLVAGGSGSSRADAKYYFSAAGSDANNCATPQLSCQTIGKLNSMSYTAGDSILLRGGERFVGCAMLNAVNVPSRGSATRPITVDSYGGGRAILLSDCPGQRALITIDGVSGVAIRNLVLSANGTQTAMGILIQNSGKQTVVDSITVQNNEIAGFNINGPANYAAEVFVTGMTISGQCGALNDIRIIGNRLHGANGPLSPDDNGITGRGCGQNITNIRYSGNEVYHIGGHNPAPNGTSGNGIVVVNVNGGEVSFNNVHDNGANAKTCGGPAGVWAFRSSHIGIRSNEVYRMRPLPGLPANACDWAAFDLDVGVEGSTVEYNYSHDNAGAGLLAYTGEKWGPNSFRYNISENDDALMANGSGAIAIASGGVSYVYNNTMYRSGSYSGTTPPSCISFGWAGVFPKGTLIANNLCVNSMIDQLGRTRYLDAGNGPDVSAITVVNNLYFNVQGYHRWNWRNVEYSSLEEFRRATEKDRGSLVEDPMLVRMGAGGSCEETELSIGGSQSCPSAYQIKHGSVVIGAGENLSSGPYNLKPGPRDYFGHPIAHGIGSGFNIGADGSAQ